MLRKNFFSRLGVGVAFGFASSPAAEVCARALIEKTRIRANSKAPGEAARDEEE
jgi:hypothetical protein